MNIEIDLRVKHGVISSHLGDITITIPQWDVIARNIDGEGCPEIFAGYLGQSQEEYAKITGLAIDLVREKYPSHHDHLPFNASLQVGEMPLELQEQIIAAVEAKIGRKVRASVPPNYREMEAEDTGEDDTDTIEGNEE